MYTPSFRGDTSLTLLTSCYHWQRPWARCQVPLNCSGSSSLTEYSSGCVPWRQSPDGCSYAPTWCVPGSVSSPTPSSRFGISGGAYWLVSEWFMLNMLTYCARSLAASGARSFRFRSFSGERSSRWPTSKSKLPPLPRSFCASAACIVHVPRPPSAEPWSGPGEPQRTAFGGQVVPEWSSG